MTERQNELDVKMFTPETRQTDSNAVILTEPCCWCCYAHHRPKWCFSDKKLRNLMPRICRDFCHFFQLLNAIFTAIFFWP